MIEFNKLSLYLTKNLNNKEKKDNGIYFTPKSFIKNTIDLIDIKYLSKQILEPSCGSCEFIDYIYNINNKANIIGIEKNITIFKEIIKKKYPKNIKLINDDFLLHNFDKKFDLIIGNPPYFVMKDNKIYKDYYDGRPNIYILFIIKSLELLNDNGILAFIIPKNFLNCLYYDKLRKFINLNYQIMHIINLKNSFLETEQNTIILIIQKNNIINNSKYILNINDKTIFTTNKSLLVKLYKNSISLYNIGATVKVGNIIWNNYKKILTNNNKYTRLIYSTDIIDNKLSLNNIHKNFIKKKGNNNIVIVVNRGYGTNKYIFNYALVDIKESYLIENHLLIISHNDINILQKIIESFNNPNTKKFIEYYFTNNAINSEELLKILPIYI